MSHHIYAILNVSVVLKFQVRVGERLHLCSILFHVVPCCSMLFHVVPARKEGTGRGYGPGWVVEAFNVALGAMRKPIREREREREIGTKRETD